MWCLLVSRETEKVEGAGKMGSIYSVPREVSNPDVSSYELTMIQRWGQRHNIEHIALVEVWNLIVSS